MRRPSQVIGRGADGALPGLAQWQRALAGDKGFSLIEVIIVVALIGFVYTVALPQFGMRSQTEVANKLNQLASDVRGAYDMAVLSKKTYRLVFMMASGDYWLEEADRSDVTLGNEKIGRDPTEEEDKEADAHFDEKMKEYETLAGQTVVDQEKEKEIKPTSPVLSARTKLSKPKWTRVETLEWTARTLGPNMMIKEMQAEHHGQKQDFQELGEKARAMVYIFPQGYIERAVIHIYFKKSELVPDEDQPSYTILTQPYQGTADVLDQYQDIDVHDDREQQ